jgi:hypothetical protein
MSNLDLGACPLITPDEMDDAHDYDAIISRLAVMRRGASLLSGTILP